MRRTRTRELQQFEHDLRAVIGEGVGLRPFVCEGSPLECEIFIVGLNAATELSGSFWDFWQPDVGFNRVAWFENYKAERESKLLAEGKTRRVVVSPTRRAIEEIVYAASPVKCLETNLYAVPTARAKELSPEQGDTRVFDFLLEAVKPQIVLLHGDDAAQYEDKLVAAQVQTVPVRHLSLHWSKDEAGDLGKELRTRCRQEVGRKQARRA